MTSNEVKRLESFPVPLDGFFRRCSKAGTLKNHLRAALAEAMEAHTGGRVLVDSSMDNVIKGALNEIFIAAELRGIG